MPASRAHGIHSEIAIVQANTEVEIDKEDLKIFSFGPDSLIATDSKTFEYQHNHKVRRFFEFLLKQVKQNKLQDNAKVMAWVYGQLEHYVLDSAIHPFIYWATEGMDNAHVVNDHALFEMWIDDYVMNKYDITDASYFHRTSLNDKQLMDLVNKVYRRVFHVSNEALKYNVGIFLTVVFDLLGRKSSIIINPFTLSLFNIGDITHSDIERITPLLNLEHDLWTNPITGEEHHESFDDLWEKSIALYLETIDDVNRYLYRDKQLSNVLISNNISYNTGLPCKKEEKFVYVKQHFKKRTP